MDYETFAWGSTALGIVLVTVAAGWAVARHAGELCPYCDLPRALAPTCRHCGHSYEPAAEPRDDPQAYVVGITAPQVERLMAGEPLHFDLGDLGGPPAMVVLFYGATTEGLVAKIQRMGFQIDARDPELLELLEAVSKR